MHQCPTTPTLLNAIPQTNAFSTLRLDPISSEVLDPGDQKGGDTSTVSPSISYILQPFWLAPLYVRIEHCTNAENKEENRR